MITLKHEIIYQLNVFDRNTRNHTTVCMLFVNIRNTCDLTNCKYATLQKRLHEKYKNKRQKYAIP